MRTKVKHEVILETEHGRARLVTAGKLLEVIWPDAECRPCIRSIRSWSASRILPSVRVGRLVFYDVEQVKAALLKRFIFYAVNPTQGQKLGIRLLFAPLPTKVLVYTEKTIKKIQPQT